MPFRLPGLQRPGLMAGTSAALLALLILPASVTAQTSADRTWAPDVVAPGAQVSLFYDLVGFEPVDAYTIEHGPGWEVVSADAVHLGRGHTLPLSIRGTVAGLLAEASEPMVGDHRIVVTLRAPEHGGASTVLLAPAVIEDYESGPRVEPLARGEVEFDVRVEPATPSTGFALDLSGDVSEAVRFEGPFDLGTEESDGFTASFWLKTVDRSQVIASTWDGQDHHDYAFEFVVDQRGEVRVFTRLDGMHYSLGSGFPIADGTWHHVALSADFNRGSMTLLVNGESTAERQVPGIGPTEVPHVTLGGRPAQSSRLRGVIDEFSLVPARLGAEEVAMMSRIPVDATMPLSGALRLGFDSERFRESMLESQSDVAFVRSDVALHHPVTNVVAEFRPNRVTLNWMLERVEPQTIAVERSVNGVEFEIIHEHEIRRDDIETLQVDEVFTYDDYIPETVRVGYYRVRQSFDDGSSMQTGVIKIGRGALEVPANVELVGNTPNPFSYATTVYFRVHEPAPYSLSVWSVSGHMVEMLASETRETGLHSIQFGSNDLPSGTYFLRLETDRGVQTLKMILRR